jgi:hypothetical protein
MCIALKQEQVDCRSEFQPACNSEENLMVELKTGRRPSELSRQMRMSRASSAPALPSAFGGKWARAQHCVSVRGACPDICSKLARLLIHNNKKWC